MNPNQELAGKVVLVTGGAQGVGRGISQRFMDAGATVVVCGRKTPASLPQSDGRSAQFHTCDVVDTDATAALVAAIVADHGRLDVLVNNAGGTPFAYASDGSPRFHQSILRLNLMAPLTLAIQANAVMQQQAEGGVIEFIGSVAATRAQPGTATYAAAKAGILSLTSSLAIEWAPKVRVVAVSPGLVETEQSALHYGDAAGIAAVAATIPAQRLAQPQDIGDACVFLAGPRASYVSGTSLLVHGGGERPGFLTAANVNQG
ncbi:NAD(P)-dependent dehydrogenase (short-subunit alcohol dehydrogenase family) [Variovorax sp. 54]|uniref:SDR family oxidoreductase n=1 Tax=Variovorax sp. 54 TaxID=2035212 RepID=UPI000C1A4DFB|nr:SDR family oxidoreductase [Variovorax sp. 54]PIF73722.1 NAD(P)-dependent dehydrogenase (short-subunit alcohol dehydrogenase family) [Variovorax sp. 54]